MTTNRELKLLAKDLADRCLSEVHYQPENVRPVPLIPLRRLLHIKRVQHLTSISPRQGAVMPFSSQLPLLEEARILLGKSGITTRYTYAHELGHWAARLRLSQDIWSGWSMDQTRQFCDEFAGRLILPDGLLLAALHAFSIDTTLPFELTISLIDGLRRRVGAPMTTVLKRLDDAIREVGLRIRNCAMLVCATYSAKRHSEFAPRILTSCTPPEWFLPSNKRLSSLGMSNLNRAFWEAPLLKDGLAIDRFIVWPRHSWRKQTVERAIRYRIYGPAEGRPDRRVMLALFPGPDHGR